MERHGVQVVREYDQVPPVQVDKHKVLQILVNLIRNAKYACDEARHARQADHPARGPATATTA